jgi:hypothetical protein
VTVRLVAACVFLLAASSAGAQSQGHPMPAGASEEPAPARPELFSSDMAAMTGMTPRDPMGSVPEAGWHVMDLGILRAVWNRQGGTSGGTEVDSGNWNMLHAGRSLGNGRISLMMMNSLEPATYPARGSRELFQTGESYRGQPLVDRQHPHDFFMNLSATYRRNLGQDAGAWVQLAPVGEPASGPIAFMHRASAGDNPAAPLGHHWQDSTHIAFHVVTVGGGWKQSGGSTAPPPAATTAASRRRAACRDAANSALRRIRAGRPGRPSAAAGPDRPAGAAASG